MQIRSAVPTDFPRILALNEESVHFLSPLSHERLSLLHDAAPYHRVLESDGVVQAFLLVLREGASYDSPNYLWFSQRYAQFLYVDRVVVSASMQGRGAGRLLYDDLFRFARANGCQTLACEFDIDPPNPQSEKFHAAYGFREVGTQRVGLKRKQVSLQTVSVDGGNGSVCTTRKMTCVGHPQLSAIIECADAAHGLGGHICGDGGCTVPGDVAKAFGGGADFVMLGGMLAAHDESGGEVVHEHGKTYRKFYGMSSDLAMEMYSGGVAKYRASDGKVVTLEACGPVEHTVQEILGGLRSTCTYVGARTRKALSKCTTFVRVTQQINEVYGRAG